MATKKKTAKKKAPVKKKVAKKKMPAKKKVSRKTAKKKTAKKAKKTSRPKTEDFEEILEKTISCLKQESQESSEEFKRLNPTEFEIKVLKALEKSAKGTSFDNSFTHISGQRFPDIICAKHGYGVEVKKTQKNHWMTIGNSIMEGNRVENIKRVYLLFGKLADPIDFRYQLYEDCLSDVKITHSPRYMIDMDLSEGKTIFSKVGESYDKIRKLKYPFQPIKDYLRKTLRKSGEAVWWVDENDESGGEAYVKLWENLSKYEKNLFQCKMMSLFPEIFGNADKKYARATSWLASEHGIASHALRDTFTAGSNVTLNVDGTDYDDIPSLFDRLQKNIPVIKPQLELFSAEEIKNYWEDDIEKSDRFEFWTKKVVEQSKLFLNAKNIRLPVKKLIEENN